MGRWSSRRQSMWAPRGWHDDGGRDGREDIRSGFYFLTKPKDMELWAPLELKMDQFKTNTNGSFYTSLVMMNTP